MTDMSYRLRKAREAAGFASAADAANRFGWSYPTYAGHENGHRGIRTDVLQDYARAFRVETTWLLEGRDTSAPAHIATGFQESAVEPITGQTRQDAQVLENMARAITSGARHHAILRATRDHLAFGIRRSDYLVIGTPENAPTTGIVVVNLVDEVTAEAVTVLRQNHTNGPIAALGDALPNEDRMTAAMMGHVLAVIRAPQLDT